MIVLNLALFAISLYLVAVFVKVYKNRRILRDIPSPPGHWLIGNAIWLIQNTPDKTFDLLRECALKYWPIYRFSSPYITVINILHPKDFEIILSQMKHLSKSNLYGFLRNWLGEGLLTSTDAKWQTRRKILTPGFHFNILQQFLDIFNEETGKLVKRFEEKCTKSSISMQPFVADMTLQVISETAMGMGNIDEITKEKYRNAIYKLGQILLTRIWKPWLRWSFVFNLSREGQEEKSSIKILHGLAYKVIKKREEQLTEVVKESYSGRKKMRMLDILLMAKINDKIIDNEGIREEVDTFMFEGHDTTTAAICFLLLSLANHQDIQKEVRAEIEEVLGPSKLPTYKDLQQLSYTERVIKETLRLYPSVPFISRIASEDFVTHTGHKIPKGTVLYLHIFDLHRNPHIYPEPSKFDPDRFLPENAKDRHPFAYLPFSAGPRNCIGQKFAMLELKAVLCGILRKFHLEEVDKETDVKFSPDLVLRTKSDIRIKFVPKDNV